MTESFKKQNRVLSVSEGKGICQQVQPHIFYPWDSQQRPDSHKTSSEFHMLRMAHVPPTTNTHSMFLKKKKLTSVDKNLISWLGDYTEVL